MALYPKATQRPIPPGPNDPPIKPRLVILHVADTEAASLYDYFNGPSGGVESHFYIRRDGTLEQYRDTARQADANVMANDFAISIETQGKAAGGWTPEQLAAIKALLTWCRDTHGIPLSVPKTWDGSGVGYHVLFEAQWDQRGASCPGPDRIKQFNSVLVPWMASGVSPQEVGLAADDVKKVNDYTKALVLTGFTEKTGGPVLPGLRPILVENQRRIDALAAQVAALSAAVKTLAESKPGVDSAAVVAAVKASVDAALGDLSITLSNDTTKGA